MPESAGKRHGKVMCVKFQKIVPKAPLTHVGLMSPKSRVRYTHGATCFVQILEFFAFSIDGRRHIHSLLGEEEEGYEQ